MITSWRYIPSARNSYAAVYAACEKYGYLLEPVESPKGDVVCYSLNSLDYAKYTCEMADSEAIIIAGGPHPSACQDEVLTVADYVVVGEGERTLPRLLDALSKGESGDNIPGVATKNGFTPVDHSVYLNAFPCFSKMKGYMEISRGCPFACGYCQTPQLHGRRMRHRFREEIVRAAEKHKDARFVTPNAFAYGSFDGKSPEVSKLERLLSSMPGNHLYFGTFPCEVRPEFVTKETADLILQYCSNTKLHFGAQSGSDEVLRKMHRGHTVLDVYAAVDVCSSAGLEPVVDVIFGFPFESDEDEEATLALIAEVVRFGRVHVHYFTPLPGTPFANLAPREVSGKVNRVLGRLALDGKVTGVWHKKF